jgi:hypothetical protein
MRYGEDRHGDIELVTPGEAKDARLPSTTAPLQLSSILHLLPTPLLSLSEACMFAFYCSASSYRPNG